MDSYVQREEEEQGWSRQDRKRPTPVSWGRRALAHPSDASRGPPPKPRLLFLPYGDPASIGVKNGEHLVPYAEEGEKMDTDGIKATVAP
ncbi:hypothetical protein JRQ81_009365 [Phrynocephalus forsythii]|uniref:Uncharacterized protein n=1 Tax=Phrynocephalus forsythii TaxID=171643 RepID=A0A9Q1ASH0_9SAUR|nr:hypothetical protein JRQ81_009365 [Phrynocephalus forsythii]